jgi:putative flippase GtrA
MGALWFALDVLQLNLYFGRVFSFFVAATFTWGCNRAYTFRDSGTGGLFRQWLKFLGVNAVGGLVNFAVYVAVIHQLSGLLVREELQAWLPYVPYAGVAAGSLSGLFVNFTASKRLIFR